MTNTQLRSLWRSVVPKARPLAFKRPELEQRFAVYRLSTSLVPARLALFAAAALYFLYGAMDVQLPRREMLIVWAIRLLVSALALLVLVRSYRPLGYAEFQRLLTVLGVLGNTGIVVMLALAEPPADRLYFGGLLLGAIYVFVLLQLELVRAFCVAALQIVLYLAVALFVTETPALVVANHTAIQLAFLITGVVAGYSIDYNARRAFLRTQSARRRVSTLSGILVDVERRRRDAEESSLRDPLTDMYNRRHFFSAARRELCVAQDRRTPLAVIMVDIDHFKSVNDTYGHAVGDLALRTVARVIGEHTRPGDVACRYGGEEFAILLAATDIDVARAVGRRLHECIRATAIVADGVQFNVSASVGVAAVQPFEDHELDELMRRADHALYVAKQNGRDQVRTWNLDAAARLAAYRAAKIR